MPEQSFPFYACRLNGDGALEAQVTERSSFLLIISVNGISSELLVSAARSQPHWDENPVEALGGAYATLGTDSSPDHPWPQTVEVETEDPTTHEVDTANAACNRGNFETASALWTDASPDVHAKKESAEQGEQDADAAEGDADEAGEGSSDADHAGHDSNATDVILPLAKCFAGINALAAAGYLDLDQMKACYSHADGPALSAEDPRGQTAQGQQPECKQQ